MIGLRHLESWVVCVLFGATGSDPRHSYVLIIKQRVTKYLEVKRTVNDDSAEEVLKRSRTILSRLRGKPVVRLTIGDRSIVSAETKKWKQGLEAKPVRKEHTDLQGLFVGPISKSLKRMQENQAEDVRAVREIAQCISENIKRDKAREINVRRDLDAGYAVASAKLAAEHHSWV